MLLPCPLKDQTSIQRLPKKPSKLSLEGLPKKVLEIEAKVDEIVQLLKNEK